jgi:hypothetical protein
LSPVLSGAEVACVQVAVDLAYPASRVHHEGTAERITGPLEQD